MKIICIGRNYAAHAAELNNEIPFEPVIFMKPQSAILKEGSSFEIPQFSEEIHYECELVLKVCQDGKPSLPSQALDFISDIGLGIDFTARDVQDACKEKGLPWEKAKAFDGSAVIGKFKPIAEFENIEKIKFQLHKNDTLVQDGDSSLMLFPIKRIMMEVTKYFSLEKGDYIFTGTPAGVGPVHSGDDLEGFIEGVSMLNLGIR